MGTSRSSGIDKAFGVQKAGKNVLIAQVHYFGWLGSVDYLTGFLQSFDVGIMNFYLFISMTSFDISLDA